MGFLDTLFGKTREDPNKDILLMVVVGNVYSWDGNRVIKAGGSGVTSCIVEHKNEIYEGTISGVVKFVPEDSEHGGKIASEDRTITALCSHEGVLYDATSGLPDDERHEIYRTTANKQVATRPSLITALASHNGILYDGGWYGIRETFSGKKISNGYCEGLCSTGNNLYSVAPASIVDVLAGKDVAEIGVLLFGHGMCFHNYRLLDAEHGRGIRETLEDKVILPYQPISIARNRGGPVTAVPNMISVNGLAYIAAMKGQQAALDAIEKEYSTQMTPQSVASLLKTVHQVRTEVVSLIEPGTQLWPEQALFLPNLMTEFNLDPQLGIIHGDGRGHSFLRMDALKKVTERHLVADYSSLAKAFFEEGYHVKRVPYVHFHSG